LISIIIGGSARPSPARERRALEPADAVPGRYDGVGEQVDVQPHAGVVTLGMPDGRDRDAGVELGEPARAPDRPRGDELGAVAGEAALHLQPDRAAGDDVDQRLESSRLAGSDTEPDE
jgi:hypothetical protein